MKAIYTFLISQAGKKLAYVEAGDAEDAMSRAKGLGHILDFSASIPILAEEAQAKTNDLPLFRNEYFELLGFTK